jgi:hypothetical protein
MEAWLRECKRHLEFNIDKFNALGIPQRDLGEDYANVKLEYIEDWDEFMTTYYYKCDCKLCTRLRWHVKYYKLESPSWL